MSDPYILNAGEIGIIHTYENESVYIDIKASCAEAIVDDTSTEDQPTEEQRREALANLRLELTVLPKFEEKQSYVNHVFGRRLVPDGGLSYELVETVLEKNQAWNLYRVTVTPLRERYGAAAIQITVADYNQEDVEYADYDEDGIAIYWQRVDDSPRMSDVKDVIIGKDRLSSVFEFVVTDEESESKDLIVDMRPRTEGIIQSINPTTPIESVKNGYIRPGWTYIVKGGSEILYSTKVYAAGSTFKGLENFKTWSSTSNSTGEEKIYELDGTTRAYQIMPVEGVTGSTQVDVSIADRMTIDYYGPISYLMRLTHYKTIYDGVGFWTGDGQGYGYIEPDTYSEVTGWDHKYVATGQAHRDFAIGTVPSGSYLVTVGYGTVTWGDADEGEVEIQIPMGMVGWGDMSKVKDKDKGIWTSNRDGNNNYLYNIQFYGVTYGSDTDGNTRFVAVGTKYVDGVPYGIVYSSEDGKKWYEEAVLAEGVVLKSVDYSNGYFVAAGYMDGMGTIIYSSAKKGEWYEINQKFRQSIFELDGRSPEYIIDDVTSISHLGNTFVLTGTVRVKVSSRDSNGDVHYTYIPEPYKTVVMFGNAVGDWKVEVIEWGRGSLVGLTNAGDYILGIGNDYTAVLITPDMRFYNQWYTNKDEVPTDAYAINSVAFGAGLIFGVGDMNRAMVSSTSVRLTEQSFVVTVTDWWETKDFLPAAIREHPLFAKTSELLDYLVVNGHINNMIKVDNLFEGKSIHFDENYLTNLLTDDSFRALDLAQENKETLAVIAANIYNIKGTVRGLKYMLSLLSVGGQNLDADVYDWVYVNKNLEQFNLLQPLDACTVLVKAKVPLSVHLDEALEHKLIEIMQSFFWICTNIVFNWTRTIETEVDFYDLFDAQEEIAPWYDSWPVNRPYDIFKYDDKEAWADVVSVFEDSFIAPSWEADLMTPVSIETDITIYDGTAWVNSWLDTQELTMDDVLIDMKLWLKDALYEGSESCSDYFDWVSADIEWLTSVETEDFLSIPESSGWMEWFEDEVIVEGELDVTQPYSVSDYVSDFEDDIEFDIAPYWWDSFVISQCELDWVSVDVTSWEADVEVQGDILTLEEQVTSWAESFTPIEISTGCDIIPESWFDNFGSVSVVEWNDTHIGGDSDGLFNESVKWNDDLDISADWGFYHSDYVSFDDGGCDFDSGMKVLLDDELEIASWLLIAYITEYPEYGIDLIWGSFEYGTEEYEVRILS